MLMYFFELYEVRELTEEWGDQYNHHRPHEGLINKTPMEWKEQTLSNNSIEISSFQVLGFIDKTKICKVISCLRIGAPTFFISIY